MPLFMIFDGYEKSLLEPFPCITAKTGKQAIMILIAERGYNIKDITHDGTGASRFSATPVKPSIHFTGGWSRTGRTTWYKPVLK